VADWTTTFLPFALVMSRVAAFFAVLPLFSRRAMPVRVRAAMALLMTIFFAMATAPPDLGDVRVAPMVAIIMMINEALVGLASPLPTSSTPPRANRPCRSA
jgi:flagellar biosynthesis protein FliR